MEYTGRVTTVVNTRVMGRTGRSHMRSHIGQHGGVVRTITVKKSDLMEKLRTNRTKHVDVHKIAVGEWLKQLALLGAALAKDPTQEVQQKIGALRPPETHTREYDRAISMLTMDVEDTVELDPQTFSQYVDDEWDWSHSWAVSNDAYVGSAQLR